MRRPTIPSFLRDLYAEPGNGRVLAVAMVSIASAGFDPIVYSPGLGSVQAAVRARPEVELLLLGATLAGAAMLFIGGIFGDTDGRRRILLGALLAQLVTSSVGLVITDGPVFPISRLAGTAAASLIVPFALALVATTYQGVARATAIGIVYAAYGVGQGASPVLLTLLGPGGPVWPGFVASVLVAAVALWFAWPRTPDLPVVRSDQRSYVVATAVWAFAIVVITTGVVWSGDGLADPVRITLIAAGLAMAAGYVAWERRARGRPSLRALHIARRPVSVAVAAGLVIGLAQAAPLFQLPLFFRIVLNYGPLAAGLATLPFVVALILAGPIAGRLLASFSPRQLVAAGLAAVGLGNLFAALVLGAQTPYIAMVVSFLLIGAGFVVGTTVRTAIIFASVPRGLPATAAALNHASVQVGARIGLVVVTVLATQVALDAYSAGLTGVDASARDAAVAAFREVLNAIGTPTIGPIALTISEADLAAYSAAYTEGLRSGLTAAGAVALVAAPLSWLALGRQDPLRTVFDTLDERAATAPSVAG